MASTQKQPASNNYFQFELNTSAITEKALEYLKPEKLTSLWEEHKSGLIVAGVWLAFCIRSWLSYLSILSLGTLPLVLLALLSLTLTTPSRTLTGVGYFAFGEISSFVISLSDKKLPTWLPRAIPVVLLFPITRAPIVLVLLAVWEIVAKYRNGIARVHNGANNAIHRAVTAAEKVGEHVREAKGLEWQAMQLSYAVVDEVDSTTRRNTMQTAGDAKSEVEGMTKIARFMEGKVDGVKELMEKAKAVAEEGDLETAGGMVVNAEKLLNKIGEAEQKAGNGVKLMRGKLWKISLGHGSG
ncbi:hypothetical protein FB567DRAFT_529860 [Paraphoma chrysanthemicola]|uniref:Uncharacterized protein n=1 Tax=Paraphoma chrysanthemicola TaxID=798071 RepID=A0A8K0R4I9_9PLEO|nr:hypothetical protein FB567DRAFT_529860 [Paraphoma chrysanthemicola]